MSKSKIYFLIFTICLAGMMWIGINYNKPVSNANSGFQACWFKSITHLPCPSCGSTRSAVLFFHGEISKAVLLNPIGIILGIIGCVFPCWILLDWIKHSESFFRFYVLFEKLFQKKIIYLPITTLVLLNWIWNIYKNL